MQAKITTRLVKGLEPKDRPYDVFDTDVTGFLLRVQPSGYMCYYLAYKTPEGRGKRFRIGKAGNITVMQARDMAVKYAAKVVHGENVQAAKQKKRETAQQARIQTLGGFLDHQYAPWLHGERPEKRRSDEHIKRLRSNFAEFLERPITDINHWVIDKWRAERRKAGKAPSAINRDINTLRGVLSKAVSWGVIESHPLANLKPLQVDPHPRIRYLSDDEERRLKDALKRRDNKFKAGRNRGNSWRRERGYDELPQLDSNTYGDHLTPMILLILNTGLRRGELFNLKWNDIDFGTKTLTVEGATEKSGKTRHIPLNTEAVNTLKAWREQSSGDGYVFPGKDGGRLDNVRKAWTGLMRNAGITDFRFHDLRHNFASQLVMAGIPLNTVRELLGHSNLNTTLRYAHLAPDHKAEAVERLSRTPERAGMLVHNAC